MGSVKITGVSASALLVVFLFASSSWADPSNGPVTVPTGRETELDLNAYVYYDSNIAASDEQLAAERGLKLADEIFEPSAQFDVARPFGNGILFVKGDAGYDLYAVNHIRDHAYVDVDGGGATHFGPCQEVLTGGYGLSQIDLAESTLGPVSSTRQTENVRVGANCGRSVGLAPSFSVEEDWLTNSNQLLADANDRSFKVNGALAYQRPVFGSIGIFGQYTNTVYPERFLPTANGSLAYSYNLYAGGIRYDRHIGGRLDAVLEISYTVLDPSSAQASKFSGLTYSFDVTYHLNSRIDLHGDAIRATDPSVRIDANYSIDETYQVDVSYKLGSRWTVKLLGDRKSSNFISNGLDSVIIVGGKTYAVLDLTQETTYDAEASITYQLTKRLSFIIRASDEERSANYPGLSFSSTKFGLTAKATF